MPKTIPQRELRNDNAKIIAAVASGETFIVTRNGAPVAELGPIREGRRTYVQRSDLLSLVFQGPPIDFEQFRADQDRIIDQGL
jgi:prevent-host-death family protein